MASFANPPQTVSTVTAGYADWQPAICRRGQPARGERRRRCRWRCRASSARSISSPGDDVQAGQVLLRLRADDDIAKLQALQATAALAQINYDRDRKQLRGAGGQPGDGRYRRCDAEERRRRRSSSSRRWWTRRCCARRSPGIWASARVDLGQYLAAGTAVVTLQALDPLYVDFYLPQQALAASEGGPGGDRACRHLSRSGLSRARSPRSIRRSIPTRATCRCAPPCAIPIIGCCPACSRRWTSTSARQAARDHAAADRDRLQSVRQTRSIVVLNKGKNAQGQRESDRAADLRHHRRDARRPGGGAEGRQGGRHRRHRRADQAAQRRRRC